MSHRRETLAGQEVEVVVDHLDAEMRGVGRIAPNAQSSDATLLTVRVHGALPGERVRVRIDHVDRRAQAYATLLGVLEASPSRVVSPCKQFLSCSGCDALHAPLSVQHDGKRAWVAQSLGLDRGVDPVMPSPDALHYRALAKFVVAQNGTLGSYRARSHDVADMQGCAVHAAPIEAVADALRAFLARGDRGALRLRYVLLRASMTQGKVSVLLITHLDTDAGLLRAWAEALVQREDVVSVYHQAHASDGDGLLDFAQPIVPLEVRETLVERIGAVEHVLLPGAFSQVNPRAAECLYERVVELAAPRGTRILDLYSGSGGIALALLAAGAREVVGVEVVAEGARAALAAARANGLAERFTSLHLGAEALPADLGAFDVIVLNPPRKGASKSVLDAILRLSPARIVYVSCNPETLARDRDSLLPAFALQRVIPVDLFPQTRHVETLALFERSALF